MIICKNRRKVDWSRVAKKKPVIIINWTRVHLFVLLVQGACPNLNVKSDDNKYLGLRVPSQDVKELNTYNLKPEWECQNRYLGDVRRHWIDTCSAPYMRVNLKELKALSQDSR